MTGLFYKFLMQLTRLLGPWVFELGSRTVAAGYFFLFPLRVRVGLRFYRACFPNRHWFFHLMCTWKQYQNFIWIYYDRLYFQDLRKISYTSRGLEHLEVLDKNSGGIILMSHMGNWEIATHVLHQKIKHKNLLLYMGVRDKEKIEDMQKQDLIRAGVKIVAVTKNESSPLDIVEGITFLKSGGLVSMAGDVLWQKHQRCVGVTFLGHDARLPEAPHLFAMLSGAPLFVFFSFRTGKGRYHFSLSEPFHIPHSFRQNRRQMIQKSARWYADILEKAVQEHPFEWFHFKPFLDT